jgi:ATP-dependent DNA ligase
MGTRFHGFTELATWIAEHLKVENAVPDGEIACIDGEGLPVFKDLLFRKSTCIFVAFDLLYLNGKDLRTLPLIERKRQLKVSASQAVANSLSRSRREWWPAVVRADCENGSGGHGLQAEECALSRNREAVTALDQGEESAVQPGGGPR